MFPHMSILACNNRPRLDTLLAPTPVPRAPNLIPLPPRLQRPSWISGTADPTDFIQDSFDGVF